MPRCCSPRSPPAPGTGWTCWPSTGGGGAGVVGAPRSGVLSAVARAMAGLQPELGEPDAAALGSAALTAARHRSLIVLLTDLNPAAVTEGLLPRLPLLAARHEVVVAAVA